MPSPSMLYSVTISSMPEGERVSMTAVSEARTLKVVLTGMPCSSFPSQSPERARNFLNAAAECVPAHSGPAMDAASKRTKDSLRRVTDASRKGAAQEMDFTELGTPQIICLDGGTAGKGAVAACTSTSRGRVTCGQRKSAVGPRWTRGASAATLFLFR